MYCEDSRGKWLADIQGVLRPTLYSAPAPCFGVESHGGGGEGHLSDSGYIFLGLVSEQWKAGKAGQGR